MDAELTEVRDFLARHAPFDALPGGVLTSLTKRLVTRYHRRDSDILRIGEPTDELVVIRSGAVELRDGNGFLVDRLDPGSTFGWGAMLGDGRSIYTVTAIEDALVVVLPGEAFRTIAETHPPFREWFERSRAEAIREAVDTVHASERGTAVLKTRVRDLVRRAPLTIAPGATIRTAAEKMRDEHASSLLVMADGALVGIMTDHDLRTRVVAEGRSTDDPVSGIMTADPVTVEADAMAFEILMTMVSRDIHHVPVLDAGRIIGLVSSTDLMRLEHANPVLLIGDIATVAGVDELAAAASRIPLIVRQLVTEDASAHDIGRVVTATGDAVERRLLELAEAELGPPPVPYCWVTLGSAARFEQGLSSDQDNALVLSDEAGPEHAAYFSSLARTVSDGLATCGYAYCEGGVMATTEAWRQPLSVWKRTFTEWVATPLPEALLRVSIFFDMRALHGDPLLVDELRRHVLALTPNSPRFLHHLAAQAVATQPPIGFFRGFVVDRSGEHRDTLNLKRRGVALVVDLARVYALAEGQSAINTHVRLTSAAATGRLSPTEVDDLVAAFELIGYLRLRHQARQTREGVAPDNHLSPAGLSAFERRHLRDAFQIIRTTQSVLSAASFGHLAT